MSTSITHFDADAHARAMAAPELTLDGYRYRGRVLSVTEWLPYWERLLSLEARKAAREEAQKTNHERLAAAVPDTIVELLEEPPAPAAQEWLRLYRMYLEAVFPRRRFRPFWAPDPVARLAALPGNALAGAFERFFTHQLRVMKGVSAELESSESPSPALGNTSSGSTPAAPAASASTS